jgi:putative colanic acid biosynthesis acetyltransferase WcaF
MIVQDNNPFVEPSFSLANRLGRLLWNIVWLVFFFPSPRPMHTWRNGILLLFGAKIGRRVHIYPNVRIWAPWQLQVGNHVGVGNGANIYNMAPISLGDFCVISQGAHLCAGTHDIDSSNFQLVARPIAIGCNAWVCAEAFIGPGVSIGEGCVIGARSVVTRSITDEWTVWSGNLAIKRRNRINHRANGQ